MNLQSSIGIGIGIGMNLQSSIGIGIGIGMNLVWYRYGIGMVSVLV